MAYSNSKDFIIVCNNIKKQHFIHLFISINIKIICRLFKKKKKQTVADLSFLQLKFSAFFFILDWKLRFNKKISVG